MFTNKRSKTMISGLLLLILLVVPYVVFAQSEPTPDEPTAQATAVVTEAPIVDPVDSPVNEPGDDPIVVPVNVAELFSDILRFAVIAISAVVGLGTISVGAIVILVRQMRNDPSTIELAESIGDALPDNTQATVTYIMEQAAKLAELVEVAAKLVAEATDGVPANTKPEYAGGAVAESLGVTPVASFSIGGGAEVEIQPGSEAVVRANVDEGATKPVQVDPETSS